MLKLAIGFTGTIGVGKTTISSSLMNIIKNLAGDNMRKINMFKLAFGDGVKEAISELYDFPFWCCYDQVHKANHRVRIDLTNPNLEYLPIDKAISSNENGYVFTIRQLCQFYGTDYIRNTISPDYWLVIAHEAYNKIIKQNMNAELSIALIEDVRFQNELNYVRSFKNNYMVRIHPFTKIEDNEIVKHASEKDIYTFKDIDIEIYPENNFDMINKYGNDIFKAIKERFPETQKYF